MSGSVFGGAYPNAGRLLHPGMGSGKFQWCINCVLGSGTVAAADRINAYPFLFPVGKTVNSIFVNTVTGGAASSGKFAILRNDPNTGRPIGTPILGSNTGFDTSVNNTRGTQSITSVYMPAAWYWGISIFTGTLPGMNAIITSSGITPYLTGDAVGSVAGNTTGLFVADAYANDIMAFDATGKAWSFTAGAVPCIGVGIV